MHTAKSFEVSSAYPLHLSMVLCKASCSECRTCCVGEMMHDSALPTAFAKNRTRQLAWILMATANPLLQDAFASASTSKVQSVTSSVTNLRVVAPHTYPSTAMVSTASDEGSSSHPPITILKRQRADAPLAQNKFLKKTARGKVLQCKLQRWVTSDISPP